MLSDHWCSSVEHLESIHCSDSTMPAQLCLSAARHTLVPAFGFIGKEEYHVHVEQRHRQAGSHALCKDISMLLGRDPASCGSATSMRMAKVHMSPLRLRGPMTFTELRLAASTTVIVRGAAIPRRRATQVRGTGQPTIAATCINRAFAS